MDQLDIDFFTWASGKTGKQPEWIQQRMEHNTEWRNMREAFRAGHLIGRYDKDTSVETSPARLPGESEQHARDRIAWEKQGPFVNMSAATGEQK